MGQRDREFLKHSHHSSPQDQGSLPWDDTAPATAAACCLSARRGQQRRTSRWRGDRRRDRGAEPGIASSKPENCETVSCEEEDEEEEEETLQSKLPAEQEEARRTSKKPRIFAMSKSFLNRASSKLKWLVV
eukprot:761282-Hanusia_phi.AAC.1